MNKTLFLFLLFPFLFTSCIEEKKNSAAETLEKINSVSIIIDDQLWNGEVGDSIRNKFAAPVIGLQQEEPLFTLNQYPVKLLDGFISQSRNIIIVRKDNKNEFSFNENFNNNPKILVRFSGRTVKDLIDSIQTNAPRVAQIIKNSEVKSLQKEMNSTLQKSGAASTAINEKFSLKIQVPSKYKTVLTGKKFIWLKKEIAGGNMNLIAYQLPYSRLKDTTNSVNSIIKVRDSIGSKYIHGIKKNTYMITESAFTPYLEKTFVSNQVAYEMKGTWELKNEFMAGPFIHYAIIDSKSKRIIVLEGFCYAPFKGKRDLLLELEAIIKTVNFN